ncbi:MULTISPECIES: FeoA family protein [unclassified Flavobacterium]|uniref:FeoA family protein n=1 Tax=unclassified Flavobacterium TaxID=196869 RepID=UPI001F14964F|nr:MULTISPECIES: FeoA family protein [unclassified Flavobacterium]UMY66533.1 ferrous iron transport protein A [Flavobacterium sp. HJ-32-4]
MQTPLSELKQGQHAVIASFEIDAVPLKLIEMGCLPGNRVEVLQIAPFGDPIYLNVNESHLAIRIETARQIWVETEA